MKKTTSKKPVAKAKKIIKPAKKKPVKKVTAKKVAAPKKADKIKPKAKAKPKVAMNLKPKTVKKVAQPVKVKPNVVKAAVKKVVVAKPSLMPKPVPPKIEPKPKGLFSLEFMINSSPDVLFEFISTPGGLENWFADRVYIIEGNFVFNWENGEKRLAKQIELRDREYVRYHWLDEQNKHYFEFKIQIDDLTSEVALIVSDFADTKEEMDESSRLWSSQVHDLHQAIGSSS